MVRKKSRAKSADSARTGRTIQSVDRAVAIMECLSGAKEGLPLTNLAASLGLAPQTVQSLLRTLQRHRWASQSERRGTYRLGPGLGEIHHRWRTGQDRITMARPIVTSLGRCANEYVVLAEWTGSGLMPLLEVAPDRELVVRGERFLADRLHTMATGKVVLSLLDEPQRRRIVSELPLTRHGPNSMTDPNAFLAELAAIHESGLAACIEEGAVGIVAIAVAVSTPAGQTPAALGLSLPASRYSPARHAELVSELRSASQSIAQAWA